MIPIAKSMQVAAQFGSPFKELGSPALRPRRVTPMVTLTWTAKPLVLIPYPEYSGFKVQAFRRITVSFMHSTAGEFRLF
jgi:hypothetical protein